MRKIFLSFLLMVWLYLLLAGCAADVPLDFHMVVDARRAVEWVETPTEHVFIEIGSDGNGSYVIYDSGGAVVQDENGMVVFSPVQILEEGNFFLNASEMEHLWRSIQENDFFKFTGDYRMSLGGSYAFIVVDANGSTQTVDNIGMDLPEIEKIIDTLNSFLPPEVGVEYIREGPW